MHLHCATDFSLQKRILNAITVVFYTLTMFSTLMLALAITQKTIPLELEAIYQITHGLVLQYQHYNLCDIPPAT